MRHSSISDTTACTATSVACLVQYVHAPSSHLATQTQDPRICPSRLHQGMDNLEALKLVILGVYRATMAVVLRKHPRIITRAPVATGP
jgi:hypothetical protein